MGSGIWKGDRKLTNSMPTSKHHDHQGGALWRHPAAPTTGYELRICIRFLVALFNTLGLWLEGPWVKGWSPSECGGIHLHSQTSARPGQEDNKTEPELGNLVRPCLNINEKWAGSIAQWKGSGFNPPTPPWYCKMKQNWFPNEFRQELFGMELFLH